MTQMFSHSNAESALAFLLKLPISPFLNAFSLLPCVREIKAVLPALPYPQQGDRALAI